MDIAALSMSMNQSQLLDKVNTAVLSKTLDTAEAQGASLISMMDRSMELSVNPGIGGSFDMSV